MIINKIIVGFVVQKFDSVTKKALSQEFISGDDVSYESVDGGFIGNTCSSIENLPYLPLEMVQPEILSPMNIETGRGQKVIYAFDKNGYDHDQEDARKYLKFGETYTVSHTDVHRSSSQVYLQEVPGRGFNTVMFANKKD